MLVRNAESVQCISASLQGSSYATEISEQSSLTRVVWLKLKKKSQFQITGTNNV